jgi:DNA-binding NarL/FixJ family response regulator
VSKLRVTLADDHALVRAGMRALLEEMGGVEVVGETGDGVDALRLVAEKKPDVALVDISMPGLGGLEVAARVRKDHAATRVMILSMHADDEYVRRALAAGATGYLLKNADREQMALALRAVARGETWLSPELSQKGDEKGGAPAVLTPRQREVLTLIADGLSTKEIASRLAVSVKTVESHRTELAERLGIHGVAALVRYAIRAGIVRPES